ncbi:hypothetical protein ABPG77_004056 [Micractinium sp. CCAP 211/92]
MRRGASAGAFRRLGAEGARRFSVVAWGANTEGQCGVSSYLPVLLQACEVEALAGLPLSSLAAGKTHSAAIAATGEAFIWGDGSSGKLGHGSTDNAFTPHRLEALVGRVHVTAAALGRQHTLLLDSAGQAWACGENKEGQCGLGTPLEELARQQRQQWELGAFAQLAATSAGASNAGGLAAAAAMPAGRSQQPGGAAAGQSAAAAAAAAQQAYEQQQFQRSMEYVSQHAWHSTHLKPFLEHRDRAAQLEAAISMYDSELRSLITRQSAWQRFESAKGSDISIPGLMPGQIATPVRLGRARQGLFSPMLPELAGLDAERIVQVCAGRYMSAALTAAGEVWAWGGGFNGELGSPSLSWSPGPRRVDGILAEVLKDNGGAIKVAAGGAFCTALTRSGRVVIWGQPMGGDGSADVPAASLAGVAAATPPDAAPHPQRTHGRRRRRGGLPAVRAAPRPPGSTLAAAQQPGAAGAEQHEVPNLRIQKQGGLLVAEVLDLPPMIDLVSGFSHVAFTDGASVWCIGRHAAAGATPSAPALHWLQPRRVMHRPDDGVASLAAGSFASAAITGSGDLHLWGTLLSQDVAGAILKSSEDQGMGHWAHSSTADAAATQWTGWEGLGSPEPTRVPGLHQVQHVALGSMHALAVVA